MQKVFPIITPLWRERRRPELFFAHGHENSFQYIYLYEYFFLFQWEIIKSKVGLPNGGSSTDALEREIALSRMKNHCVTPGEKYCCFA